MRHAAALEHQGGYRDAIAPSAKPAAVELGDGIAGLEDLRRAAIIGAMLSTLAASIAGALVGVIVAQLALAPIAIVYGAWIPLAVLFVTARRARRAHRTRLRDRAIACGRLVYSPRRGWSFVGDDGTSYEAFPRGERAAWHRGGPYVARIVPALGASIAWAPLPMDPADEAELRQHALDAHLGVTPAERALLAGGRMLLRTRLQAALRALAWIASALAATMLLVTSVLGITPRRLLPIAVVLVPAILVSIGCALPHARAALRGECLPTEGIVRVFGLRGPRYEDCVLSFGRAFLKGAVPVSRRTPGSFASVVENEQRIRAYYCPSRLEVLALEHVSAAPSPPICARSEELHRSAEPMLDTFRSRFH